MLQAVYFYHPSHKASEVSIPTLCTKAVSARTLAPTAFVQSVGKRLLTPCGKGGNDIPPSYSVAVINSAFTECGGKGEKR